MMRTHTSKNGSKTASRAAHSALSIQNKDPNFDYSFRRRQEIQDAGGEDIYGWTPISEGNTSGEFFSAFPGQKKTAGSKEMYYLDTVACRRPKEVSKYFKSEEDDKYNSQIAHVRSAAKRAKAAFREMDEDAKVKHDFKFKGPGMTQRTGPTEEGE